MPTSTKPNSSLQILGTQSATKVVARRIATAKFVAGLPFDDRPTASATASTRSPPSWLGQAQALADQIGNGATVGTFGARPAGDIVVLAVLYTAAVDVVANCGDALAGKILVDITNPFNADVTGLVTTVGNSVSEQIAAVAPEGAHVVKAFNTVLRGVLAEDMPLDVFFAADSVEAKARIAAFMESVDLRPLDTGGLEMAHALEWAGVLLVGLARNGADFDIALGAKIP